METGTGERHRDANNDFHCHRRKNDDLCTRRWLCRGQRKTDTLFVSASRHVHVSPAKLHHYKDFCAMSHGNLLGRPIGTRRTAGFCII